MKVDDILVHWVIPTFDRRIKGPMPPPTHYYELDWTKALENERAEIIKILGISDESHKQEPVRFGITSETFSVGANKPDDRMLRFRWMFIEKSIEELSARDSKKPYRLFTGVNLNREYFEDETGQEISSQEMIQIATGDKNIILFDIEGIAKIGPTDICTEETWNVDKANILFNFLQVVRLIWRSHWLQKRSAITFSSGSVVKCDFPTVENMCAVLTLFRQLYASDALINKACKIYNEHCSNANKKRWVNYCKKQFNKRLGDNPFFIRLPDCSVRQLFEAFLNGTGIIHSPSSKNQDKRSKLSELVRQHGREKVIMAVNASFWMALEYAVNVFHIVRQDYEHWIEQEGCAKSDMFDIYSLLQSN